MLNPKVSVIIPVYNGEKTLSQCLDSVLNQNFEDYEIIIVDNFSEDRTKELINQYMVTSNKIRYVFEAHRSRGAARNAGITVAQGEIVVMTDCDCIVPNQWIQNLTAPLLMGNELIIMGYEEEATHNFWSRNIQRHNYEFFKKHLNGDYITCLDTKNFAIRTWLMRKLMFDRSLKHLEDYELALRIRDQYKIRFIPNIRVKHFHKTDLFSWLRINFEKGYWASIVFRKYRDKSFIQNDPMFDSVRLNWFNNIIRFLLLPGMIIKRLIKNPSKKNIFDLTSLYGWEAGLLLGRR